MTTNGSTLISYTGASEDAREVELEKLARLVIEDPDALPERLVDAAVAAAASPNLTEQQRALGWSDYVEAVRQRDGLGCGLVDWRTVEPELTCSDPQEEAFQHAAESVNSAARALLRGPNRPAGSTPSDDLQPAVDRRCGKCAGQGCAVCDDTGREPTEYGHALVAFLRSQGVAL